MGSLTENEKLLIARRAAGEYACGPQLRKISLSSKSPDDGPFLDFLREALKKSPKGDVYERLQRAVLRIIPEPFGPQRSAEQEPEPVIRRVYTCKICGQSGHNARGCPEKPDAPTVVCSDGLTRLTPGFDPSQKDRAK